MVWSKSEDAQWVGFKANSNDSKLLWPETFGWFTVVQEPQCTRQVEGVKLQSKHSSTSWWNPELYGYITIFKSHLWFQISNQRCYIICEPNQTLIAVLYPYYDTGLCKSQYHKLRQPLPNNSTHSYNTKTHLTYKGLFARAKCTIFCEAQITKNIKKTPTIEKPRFDSWSGVMQKKAQL